MRASRITVALVAALTVLGVVLRLSLLGDSLVADELSTRWMITAGGLWDVIAKVYSDAEITPPLSFVLSWLTTRVELSNELLRLPSLLAGAATIPLVYAVGARTVGARAALLGTALTALSPFLLFYSTEARSYALMILCLLCSTYALLRAVEDGRTRWWVAFGVATCAAMYSHYTSVFPLAAQLAWALWAHPAARRPALVASAVAALAFAPWLPGLRGDMTSGTTEILSALQPFTAGFVRTALAHWVLAYPYGIDGAGIGDLPGVPALALLAAAVALGAAGLALRVLRERPRIEPGLVLIVALAVAAPVGEALVSAFGSNLFGTRNLAGSWPAMALCLSALILAAGPRLGVAAAALAVVAFAIGAYKMLQPDFRRADFDGVAAQIVRESRPGDVVVDAAQISPAGVPRALTVALGGARPIFDVGRDDVRYDPFRIAGLAPPPEQVLERAASAARGHRMFLVVPADHPLATSTLDALPPGWRPVETRTFPGANRLELVVAADQTATGA